MFTEEIKKMITAALNNDSLLSKFDFLVSEEANDSLVDIVFYGVQEGKSLDIFNKIFDINMMLFPELEYQLISITTPKLCPAKRALISRGIENKIKNNQTKIHNFHKIFQIPFHDFSWRKPPIKVELSTTDSLAA